MTRLRVDAALESALETYPADPAQVAAWLRSGVGNGLAADVEVATEEWSIASPDPTETVLGLRVFTPPVEGPLPVVLFCHGGAFAIDDEPLNFVLCRDLAVAGECIVVAVEYRLSPAHTYPAAFNDCYQALTWIAELGHLIDADSSRIAVHGISAGGALAAAVTIAARDRGGPSVAYLQLVNPLLDDRMATASVASFTDTPLMHKAAVVAAWEQYLGDLTGGADVYAAPGRLEHSGGLPPTYLEVAQLDPLRDEGLAFGVQLLASGTEVELHLRPGTFHGSEMFLAAAVSANAAALRGAALRRAFARTTQP